MAKAAPRTAQCGKREARARLTTARAYLDVATTVLDEQSRDEFLNVAAGLAVLAGIAASDAICCARLRHLHRGDDHRGATDLLKKAVPDGAKLSNSLARLLDLKDEAHYGVMMVSAGKARGAARWAETLVTRAADEVER
jgi:hypothetical protein